MNADERAAAYRRWAERHADTEAGLFMTFFQVAADAELEPSDRSAILGEVGELIDVLRKRRGLDDDPAIEDLIRQYDRRPPAPPAEIERGHPGLTATPAIRIESVGGRTRAFPIVRMETRDGEVIELCPEPPGRG